MSNIVLSYPDNWHYYLILKVSSRRGMSRHTLGHKTDRNISELSCLEMQLHFVKRFWLTSRGNLTHGNGPYISLGLFMMHLGFSPRKTCLGAIFFHSCTTAVFQRPSNRWKQTNESSRSVCWTWGAPGSRRPGPGHPVTPAAWGKWASTGTRAPNETLMTQTRSCSHLCLCTSKPSQLQPCAAQRSGSNTPQQSKAHKNGTWPPEHHRCPPVQAMAFW